MIGEDGLLKLLDGVRNRNACFIWNNDAYNKRDDFLKEK